MYAQWKILRLTLNQVAQQATFPLSWPPALKRITGTQPGSHGSAVGWGLSCNTMLVALVTLGYTSWLNLNVAVFRTVGQILETNEGLPS